MAMLISNTHLRVPHGFGALLEGLTREILRDQPKDIPKYAAQYFEALLKQREESGIDPSEWAAKLEDRYYNNHSFKTSDHASRTTVSNKNTQDSTAEDCSGQSEEDVSMTTMKAKHLTTSEEGEESSPILTQAESAKGPPGSSPDPTASTQADGLSNEINNSTASNSESESHEVQLLRETENTKTQESDAGGEEDDDQKHTDQGDKAGNLEEIADTASILEEETEQNVAFESSEIRLQTPVSQLEITEQKQEQADYDADGCTTSDDIQESNDKALVEISFEDVPENQQSKNNELGINVEVMEKTDTISNEQEAQLAEKRQDDDNEENISIHDNSGEESVDIIDTVHHSTTKADNLVSEDTNNMNNDENSSLKDKFEKYDLTEDTVMGEGETEGYQEIEHQKSVDNDSASDLAQLTDSNVNIFEEQVEMLEKGEDDLSEEEEQYQDETLEKYFTISQERHSEEEELVEETLSDSEDKEGHSSHDQANVNPDLEEWPDKEGTGRQEEQKDSPDPEGQAIDKQEECSRPQEEEDIMDIPLDDPEANRAAAKIQAGFRGHMTRKKMKPEDKTEGEEVSSSGDVLSSRQGGTETGGSRPVGSDDTSVPEQ